jgi:integrase/recombinase XerC
LDYLVKQANNIRDKAIISLFADSGLRLSELASINPDNINWKHRPINVVGKCNKQSLTPSGIRTKKFLKDWLSKFDANGRLWDINKWGINIMLQRLCARTGLPCNAHTFRRAFVCILAERGVDSLHIKRLGRWESMQMVERYTSFVMFEDSLRFYKGIL